jgi:hypothetical protein
MNDHDSYRARRRARLAKMPYGVGGISYGVSGPSHMPTLSPTQFGEGNTELTSSTEESEGDSGGPA